jgi:hypothetical protein
MEAVDSSETLVNISSITRHTNAEGQHLSIFPMDCLLHLCIWRVRENSLQRRMFVCKREDVAMWQDAGQDCMLRNLLTCCFHQILLRSSDEDG